ncbi:MAG TPA: WGR domain-containing protein, partial [Polyangiaceae bacterium]|nr:WGR domain-containing protein [Polyangiaceae bacterium]
MDTKRYEFSEGSSNKFWQIARDGASLRVTFGKIGTAGQAQLKELASEAAAIAEHDKLVKEKTKKGYVLVSQDAAPAGPAPVAKVKTKTPKSEEAKSEEPPAAQALEQASSSEAPPAAPPPVSHGDYVLEERYVGEGFTISDGSYAALAAAWFAPGMRAAKEHVASLKAGRSKTLADLQPAVDQVVAFLESEGETTLGVPAGALLLRLGL